MEPGALCNARAMSLMDSPAFHRSHNSFLPAADNPPGRPNLATYAPPIRTTPKTLPCCTDRLNPPPLPLEWKIPTAAPSQGWNLYFEPPSMPPLAHLLSRVEDCLEDKYSQSIDTRRRLQHQWRK